MTPGDEVRMEREAERLQTAARLFRRSAHLSAGAAIFGMGAGYLILQHGAMPGALWLIGASFLLHFFANRAMKRGRALL